MQHSAAQLAQSATRSGRGMDGAHTRRRSSTRAEPVRQLFPAMQEKVDDDGDPAGSLASFVTARCGATQRRGLHIDVLGAYPRLIRVGPGPAGSERSTNGNANRKRLALSDAYHRSGAVVQRD